MPSTLMMADDIAPPLSSRNIWRAESWTFMGERIARGLMRAMKISAMRSIWASSSICVKPLG